MGFVGGVALLHPGNLTKPLKLGRGPPKERIVFLRCENVNVYTVLPDGIWAPSRGPQAAPAFVRLRGFEWCRLGAAFLYDGRRPDNEDGKNPVGPECNMTKRESLAGKMLPAGWFFGRTFPGNKWNQLASESPPFQGIFIYPIFSVGANKKRLEFDLSERWKKPEVGKMWCFLK